MRMYAVFKRPGFLRWRKAETRAQINARLEALENDLIGIVSDVALVAKEDETVSTPLGQLALRGQLRGPGRQHLSMSR